MTPQSFVTALQSVKLGNVFNLYADRCALYDVSNAPARRAQSLLCLLTVAADTEIEDLWIGRDLGYRGGRRTGLALTDDIHLNMHRSRWNVQVQRAKMGEMVAERTAAVVWKCSMRCLQQSFFGMSFRFTRISLTSHLATEHIVRANAQSVRKYSLS